MHYTEWARTLLHGSELEEKLFSVKSLEVTTSKNCENYLFPKNPGRSIKLQFDNKQIKFPKRGSFHQDDRRALALHFFANHELLAIEMMASALLRYPDQTADDLLMKKGLIKTILDEQKHLKLYLKKMKDLGLELGDFPLNDFFWRQMEQLQHPSNFYALMGLTFESANLDFALYYEMCFKEVEDFETAKIMRIVLEDEVSHVAIGAKWLNQWREDQSLWDYYKSHLPFPITPARSKGMTFNRESRLKAGLSEEFINTLEHYKDPFGITNRRTK